MCPGPRLRQQGRRDLRGWGMGASVGVLRDQRESSRPGGWPGHRCSPGSSPTGQGQGGLLKGPAGHHLVRAWLRSWCREWRVQHHPHPFPPPHSPEKLFGGAETQRPEGALDLSWPVAAEQEMGPFPSHLPPWEVRGLHLLGGGLAMGHVPAHRWLFVRPAPSAHSLGHKAPLSTVAFPSPGHGPAPLPAPPQTPGPGPARWCGRQDEGQRVAEGRR